MYIRPLANPNAPVAAPKSDLLSRAIPALSDFTSHQLAPIVSGLQQWGLLRSGTATIEETSPPWDNWASERASSRLLVFGQEIPDGVVLTHCDVSDDVDYRAIPTSNLNPVALGMLVRASIGTQVIDGKKQTVAKNATVEITKMNGPKSSAAGRAATAQGMKILSDAKGDSLGEAQKKLFDDPGVDGLLDTASYQDGANRLRSKFNKVRIGDQVPKRAELRLVLHDVLFQSGTRLALETSRHRLLGDLRALFCANPSGQTLLRSLSEQTLRSVAASISANNLSGRLVSLSSKGLDPYQVKTWVTTSFSHREVPDSNVIAVRIALVEFESLYSFLNEKGPIQGPIQASGKKTLPAAPAPAKPERPSFKFAGTS